MKRAAMLVAALCALLVGGVVYSFVPVPALIGVSYTAAGGSSYASLAALAGGIGAALWSVDIKDQSTGAASMRVRVAPDAPARVPGGWTPAANPANDPIAPSSAAQSTLWGNANNGGPWVYSSALEACQQTSVAGSYNHVVYANGTYSSCYGGAGAYCCWYLYNGSSSGNTGMTGVVGCPTGYSVSGSSCTLANSNVVAIPPDLECGVKISGGVISYDSRDPDCTGTAPSGVVKSADGKAITVSNAKTQVKIVVLADGSVQVTHWTPSASDPTRSTVQQIGATSPAASSSPGVINGVLQADVNAVGQPAFGVTPAGVQTAGSPQSITFPDDYARENTAQSSNTKLGDIKTALTDPGTPAADPAAKTPEEITAEFFPSTFSGLKAWAFPSRSVACPTWSFSVWSHSYTIDAHCGLIESQRALFSAIMLLVWALVALFIVMGA